ncbi:hypothetical protein SCP_1101330 [Sparassis crispa]|uniref:Uncharacterized protein n=1 Tax=Sparassis crispa TaxID=139825 RepID=A0A401GZ64_9APHY|nr:hypothetical protein SCP_1101330 [Sparassis crispa]GBE87457.1 hypothetical protein SCP_1101330 [Sparassis crispa]
MDDVRRPDFIALEDWKKMSENQRAVFPPRPSIDPHLEQRVHGTWNSGPQGDPYPPMQREEIPEGTEIVNLRKNTNKTGRKKQKQKQNMNNHQSTSVPPPRHPACMTETTESQPRGHTYPPPTRHHPHIPEHPPSQIPSAHRSKSSLHPPSDASDSSSLAAIAHSLETLHAKQDNIQQRLNMPERNGEGAPTGQDSECQCGAMATRGKTSAAKRKVLRQGGRGRKKVILRDDDQLDTAGDDESDDDDAEDLVIPKLNLSKAAQKARADLQACIMAKFRFICGVPEGEEWPSPMDTGRVNVKTDKEYFTPNFKKDVRHPDNQDIFERIADLVQNDIETSDKCLETLKQRQRYRWDQETLVEFTKSSFRGFKVAYSAQVNDEKKKAQDTNQRTNHHKRRREAKVKNRLTTVQQYATKYNVDSTDLLHEMHMSDEASGPEEGSGLSVIAWKRQMANHCQMDGNHMNVTELEKLKFREHILPSWRSDELSNIFKELDTLAWQAKSAKEKERIVSISVRDTGRSTDIPPLVAPFDFGINKTWWEVNKDDVRYKEVLTDWYMHGDLLGFGSAVDNDEEGRTGGGSGDSAGGSDDDANPTVSGEENSHDDDIETDT